MKDDDALFGCGCVGGIILFLIIGVVMLPTKKEQPPPSPPQNVVINLPSQPVKEKLPSAGSTEKSEKKKIFTITLPPIKEIIAKVIEERESPGLTTEKPVEPKESPQETLKPLKTKKDIELEKLEQEIRETEETLARLNRELVSLGQQFRELTSKLERVPLEEKNAIIQQRDSLNPPIAKLRERIRAEGEKLRELKVRRIEML